jgi:hypothetical protein
MLEAIYIVCARHLLVAILSQSNLKPIV